MLKERLEENVFVGLEGNIAEDSTGNVKFQEKIIICYSVEEEKLAKGIIKGPGFFSKDEEDEEDKRGTKERIICITSTFGMDLIWIVNKKARVRVHKLIEDKPNVFASLKIYTLDDIKSLESVSANQIIINFGKPYKWTTESASKKVEFIYHIIKVKCQFL